MRPKIDKTKFGSITIAEDVFAHNVIIRRDGEVRQRKKKLSKAIYGTSHVISLAEARHTHEKGAKQLIIGPG
jgi:hypothetical protein